MKLPDSFLKSLECATGFSKMPFEETHSSGNQITSIRVNSFKQSSIQYSASSVAWSQYGFYLDSRPSFTFDPLFHAGCYYVQEASSMFLEQALQQTVELSKPLKVLDLCAAPGGKSTHIQSLISKDSLLVSNEVIRARANVLKDNIIKWGCENVVVTNNDPKDFAQLANYFDVIVVDAPCSGSGLFRREPEAINEWSENNVQLCSQRQQRILADVLPALKKDGVLIYSTCSYSKEEDENIVDWLLNKLPVVHCPLHIDNSWGIVESGGGYRFWPDKVKGEGFFITCFKKTEGKEFIAPKQKRIITKLEKREAVIIEKWMDVAGKGFIKYENTVYAWPLNYFNDFSLLLDKLKVVYSGVVAGELIRDKLVPDHALAMSKLVSKKISKTELSKEEAICYLQRKEFKPLTPATGWCLSVYQNQALGWMNILPGRINNYYPKSLRILKDSPE